MAGKRKAIIIGAGPAGLTAAYELLCKSDVKPVVFEMSDIAGGLSRTVGFNGNRIDLGGHRFFSKSDRVMQWWLDFLPMQGQPAKDYRKLAVDVPVSSLPDAPDPDTNDRVMLVRNRLSRIYFLKNLFDYPLSLGTEIFFKLGLVRASRIALSYLRSRLYPIRDERNLEEFFINRFGHELYRMFFKDYTEKVWGVDCKDIPPEWGAQRIKNLSIGKAVLHALKGSVKRKSSIGQKNIETSLIEQFFYPKFGPGQLWETVARRVEEMGGEIVFNRKVTGIQIENGSMKSVVVEDASGNETMHSADYVISTMAIKDLVAAMGKAAPEAVKVVAAGLMYRDFATVGLVLKKLKLENNTKIPTENGLIPDNWIYIQDHEVKVGRIQIFNNWSPYMVKDPDTVLLGMEYFLNESDELWRMSDEDFVRFAIKELTDIDIIEEGDVLEHTVIRQKKTYPGYFGTYSDFDVIRKFTDDIPNLFLIGRNGMHRYNNQDHSMLTAMLAAEMISAGDTDKRAIWEVNSEEDYHESKPSTVEFLKKRSNRP